MSDFERFVAKLVEPAAGKILDAGGAPSWLLWEFKHHGLAQVVDGKVIPAESLSPQQVVSLALVNKLAEGVLEGFLQVEFDGVHDPIYRPTEKTLELRRKLGAKSPF